MIHKSISIALCFSTVLSSISWSMDAPSHQSTQLRPVDAFYIGASSTQQALTQNVASETSQAFVQGAQRGFSSYASDTFALLQNIWNGNIRELSEGSLQSMIQQSLGTNLRRYQERNAAAHARGEIDADSVKAIFTAVREGVYQSLMRTGAFGTPQRVYVPERSVTETHYNVSLSVAASFVNTILPNALPLRGALISLINNSQINGFLLNQIDALFARLTVRYFEKITGIKLNQVMLGSLGIVGLSGIGLSKQTIDTALSDYENADDLPELTQKDQQSFSELWNYINPRLTHYIRNGIIESVMGVASISADKISDPAGLALARAIQNNSQFITGTIGLIGYTAGEALTSIPLVDGAFGAGIAYWLSNGVLQAALPSGIDESRRKLIEMTMRTLRLTATYYVNEFLPVRPTEHRLFGLNPAPTPTELALFRPDYEEQDRLNQQSLVAALIRDLASTISTPISSLLKISGISAIASALLGSGNKDGLALLTAPQGHAQPNHHDTAARIQLFELAQALDAIEKQQTDFTNSAPWYSRALAYWNGEIPNKLKLTDDQQRLLDTIRKHPSFEFLKAELDHLAKNYTWLSRNDRKQNLQPYEVQRKALSADFTQEAKAILSKINAAKIALNGKVQDIETAISTLMNTLSMEHFVIALDAIIDTGVRDQFDFKTRPITDLPGFAVALKDYSELLNNHESLVRLIQTNSLGMDLTLEEQLQQALILSRIDSARERLLLEMEPATTQPIPTIEAKTLHERYKENVAMYLGTFYGQKFLDKVAKTDLDEIIATFDRVPLIDYQEVPAEYAQKCFKNATDNPKFKAFLTQLGALNLDRNVRTTVYQHIIQDLIQRRLDKDAQSSQQTMPAQPAPRSSWLSWSWQKTEDSGSAASASAATSCDLNDWVLVGDGLSEKSRDIIEFFLPELSQVRLETFEDQGFEAYFVADTIKKMIESNPHAFGGRSVFALTAPDMLKVTQHIDSVRRSQVISSEDLMKIERHNGELAALVQKDHADSVIWTYDTLLTELRAQASRAINSVQPVSDSSGSGNSDQFDH